MQQIRVGCCGWCMGRSKYYSELTAIELQDTFYDRPDPDRLSRLRSEAPEGFRFTMKAWQAVTHPPDSPTWRRAKERPGPEVADKMGLLRTTKENLEAWDVTARAARALGASLVVVQTPPSFGFSEDNERQAAEFFATVSTKDFVIGWEPRGSWRNHLDAVARVLERSDNVVHVVDPLVLRSVKFTPVAYFRLHGLGRGEVNYRYRYTEDDLRRLINEVSKYAAAAEVYVMFNNVYMKDNARELINMLKAQA